MPRPNVLIFMTDHQRGDTVLPEHGTIAPNVARLAREGVTFTEAYCPSPHCCPARATFHSGLYPSGHGVWNNVQNPQALATGLAEGVRLWSEDLAEAGYRLHHLGKWHVSAEEDPADRGWVQHTSTCTGGQTNRDAWKPYERLAAGGEPARPREPGEILRPGYGTYRLYGRGEGHGVRGDRPIVEEALEVLRGLVAGDDPWVLYVGCGGPHDPYIVPDEFVDRYPLDSVPLPPSYADALADKPRIYARMRRERFGQLPPEEVRDAIRHYRAFCTLLDAEFGRLLDVLDASGRGEDTLVLYASDHGDYAGEHGLFAKGIPCFRGAYHVPAVVRWPGRVSRPGRREDAFVSLADFAPTLLEAAGVEVDRHFAGRSLVPLLEGRRPEGWRDAVFTQCDGVELYYSQRSVTTRRHKYVFNGFDDDELYDLAADPHEMRNVSADPAYAEVKRDLVRRMWQFARAEGDTMINQYITVSLAPWGPALALE